MRDGCVGSGAHGSVRVLAQLSPSPANLQFAQFQEVQGRSAIALELFALLPLAKLHVELAQPEEVPPLEGALPPMEMHHVDPLTGEDEFALETAQARSGAAGNGRGGSKPVRSRKAQSVDPADPSTWGKVQRNAPCPCGSGKKYKHCHGAYS